MTPAWMFSDLERRDKGGGGGGGGRARIRLGRTGPRGRRYSNPKTPRARSSVVKSKFVRAGRDSGRHIRSHLQYIEERERGDKERERDFFDRDRNGIERKEVERAMLENRGEKVAMHKLILSPGENNIDIRDYTRESMERLEDRLGHRLDWYAVVHENTEHHHAHVVIAGKMPDRERELERREAREDSQWLDRLLEREMTDASSDRLRDLLWEARESDRWDGIEKALEREEADPRVRDLLPDRERSLEEIRTEKMLDRYEREMAAKEGAMQRGDVYLDRLDLQELRYAGNDYLTRERSVDREIEHALERELGREYVPERERDRGDLDLDRWEIERVQEHSREDDGRAVDHDRDDRGRGRGDDDEQKRERDRDRGDDFGR